MGIIFQVGEIRQMPRTPHQFPKCGNWRYTPPIMEEEEDDSFPANGVKSLNVWLPLALIVLVFFV
jgi:hypothetical protein